MPRSPESLGKDGSALPAHSPRSPSGADRWMTCPGSVRLCNGLPDTETSYSAEGTFLHMVSAECLQLGLDAYAFIGTKAKVGQWEFELTEELADDMQPVLDRIREYPGRMFIEKRVSLSPWAKDDYGTLDCGIVSKKVIRIIDQKWGEGEIVEVVRNRQLMLYALGFWRHIARHLTDAHRFVLTIEQPRVAGGGASWEVSLDELLEFGEEVKKAVRRTKDPDAPLVPSKEACRWCKAFNSCPAAANKNLELLGLSFEDLDEAAEFGTPLRLKDWKTPERRAVVIDYAPVIRRWLDALHNDALEDYLAGRPVGPLKAVNGRKGPRKFKDEKAAERALVKFLGANAFNKKLKTPSQVEKELTKDQFSRLEKFIGQSDGKPALVPLSDSRPAIKPTSKKFKNLDTK